jgi:hypothetical protein
MQAIQSTPATQLVQALEAAEAVSQQLPVVGRFVPTEPHVPITVDVLKRRAVQATEESQADKGIGHTLFTCGECATIWRSRGYTLCPTCAGHVGDILFLDDDQRIDVSDAVFDQKEPRAIHTSEGWVYTRKVVERAMGEFRALLEEYAPWYDRTNRKLIQACHFFLRTTSGTSPKEALAIHFFKEEWARASDDERTFCPEVIQE